MCWHFFSFVSGSIFPVITPTVIALPLLIDKWSKIRLPTLAFFIAAAVDCRAAGSRKFFSKLLIILWDGTVNLVIGFFSTFFELSELDGGNVCLFLLLETELPRSHFCPKTLLAIATKSGIVLSSETRPI
ncbi:hypothetical protein ACHWQZ_G014967 [Mnemiopsis leidyi]